MAKELVEAKQGLTEQHHAAISRLSETHATRHAEAVEQLEEVDQRRREWRVL